MRRDYYIDTTMRNRSRKLSGLIVIIIAAVLLQGLAAVQYRYARNMLETELERNTLMDLITSALRIQEVLSMSEVAVDNAARYAEDNLDDPDYMNTILYNMVVNDDDNLDGAFACFEPNFFPRKGYWYEPYVHQTEDGIVTSQVASAEHDYTQNEFYQSVMRGDGIAWTSPYRGTEGELMMTYSLPLHQDGRVVGLIGADLSIEWINDVINHYHPYPSSFSMVVSEEGMLLSSPPDSLANPELVKMLIDMFNNPAVPRKLVGRGRITRYQFYDAIRGENGRVYYAEKTKAPHWNMMLVCYDNEIFGKLERMRHYVMLLSLFSLGLLVLIISLFARSYHKLQITQLRQESLNSELRVAKDIQMNMLPSNNVETKQEGIDIFGYLLPAREVGGDLYNFFVRDGKLFFCIGDVSGKGVPAAMTMAQTMSLLRSAPNQENNPARIMRVLNRTLSSGNDSNMFVTMFLGILDLPTGQLRYCDAGHDAPLVMVDGEKQVVDVNPNLPLGVFEDTQYEVQETQIKPGSMILLYTDGLTEAKDNEHHQYGLHRIEELLELCAASSPMDLIESINESVRGFVKGAEQSDDLTLLAIKYSPLQFESKLTKSITLKNNVREVARLSEFIKSVMEELSIDKSLSRQLRLAIEEAVVNVIDYAYPPEIDGKIDVQLQTDGKRLKVIICDSGAAFDPTTKEQTDTSLSVEDRQIGGLGILLVRELMDTINYERVEGKNILTLIKNI